MSIKTNEITLLLLEDDDIDAMAITRALAKMNIGNNIIRACDGQEGLELLRSGAVPSPYLILLDIQMPRLSGLEFLEEIRQDPVLDKHHGSRLRFGRLLPDTNRACQTSHSKPPTANANSAQPEFHSPD